MTSNKDEHAGDFKRRIPQLKEIDDSKSGRFPTRSAAQWVPGVVEVEFRSSSDFRLTDQELLQQDDRNELPKQASKELAERLMRNKIVAWQPSFAVVYPWTRESKEDALKSFRALGRDKFVTFRFSDDADVSAVAKELESLPEIVHASPVAELAPPSTQIDDELLGTSDQIVRFAGGVENQWYAIRCKLPEALERARGRDVIIADIDWGFSEHHSDYAPFIEKRKNIFRPNGTISEGASSDHGSAVLGLAGARADGEGMVGFAPESILWAIQAGRDEIVNRANWIEALDFVRTEPATQRKVIILEIQTKTGGNIEAIDTIRKAIIDAIDANIVVCVPAGNSTRGDAGRNDNDIPIPPTGSVLVGATRFGELDNEVCSKSGARIVVYAPGDKDHDVTCSIDDGTYRNKFGGSSGAVAKVAGAVALMLELNPYLTPVQVREILAHSQVPVVKSGALVGRLLDCADALNEVSPV